MDTFIKPEDGQLLNIQQAAKMFGVHPETMRRWDRAGKLKSVRVGERGHRKYDVASLKAFIHGDSK